MLSKHVAGWSSSWLKHAVISKQLPSRSSRTPDGNIALLRIERRRRLCQRYQQEQLVQLWRIITLLGFTTGLGFLLLRLGWTLRSPSQICIKGNVNLSAETIFQTAGLRFPQQLLDLNPQQIEQQLVHNLPIISASVNRYLLPCSLKIHLRERRPVAMATRIGNYGKEHGLIDHAGHWIPLHIVHRSKQPLSKLVVQGWQARQRNRIARMLDQRNDLGAALHQILVQPDGSVSLVVEGLGLVHLGQDSSRLEQQLEAVRQIGEALPDHWRGEEFTEALDLSNPSEPELQISQAKSLVKVTANIKP